VDVKCIEVSWLQFVFGDEYNRLATAVFMSPHRKFLFFTER